MANQQAKPSLLRKQGRRALDSDVAFLARFTQSNQDTKLLIAGAREQLTTSWELLGEISRLLAQK